MKKRTILALSTVLVASSLLSSCSDAKVEQAETAVETTDQTTPIEEVVVVEETTPVEEVEVVEVIEEDAKVIAEQTEAAPTKKATATPKEEVKKIEKKAEAKVEAVTGTPQMTFEKTEFEFGEIAQGDKVSHTFNFKNTGTAPLLITNARASCGCTVPEWPKEAIAPGQSGKIDVVFNSRGKSGNQNKAVTITTNIADQPQQIVYLKGNVTVPQSETTPAE